MRRLPTAEIIVVAVVLLLGAGIFWWAHRDQSDLEESKERGAAVVAGLEAYHARHGTYPETLEELAPEYAPRIEQPSWGLARWRYRRFTPADVTTDGGDDRHYFQLSVAANESGYPILYYDYTARRWVLNN